MSQLRSAHALHSPSFTDDFECGVGADVDEVFDTVATRGPLWFACKKAGLRQIGWHVLRHTFASHLVMCGATMTAVQELLCHCSIVMTMRCAHPRPGGRSGDRSPP